MHWRKFAIADIPLEDQPVFDKWLQARWHEKDALLEHYLATERFPGEESAIHGSAVKSPEDNFIETEVKLANSWELFNAYRIISAFGMVFWFLPRMFFSRGKDRA
jgi:lysocardiolipin and lysophospholipid acyltransferase